MTSPRRSRAWIWFFLVLALLSAAAVAIPLWFNLSQQLTEEELDKNKQLWEEKRPSDYDVAYTQQGASPEQFVVHVRHGRVRSITSAGRPLEPEACPFTDMDSLFRYVANYLEQDRQPGSRRTFASAGFARDDGHIVHYIRSVWSTRERTEITVELHRVAGEPARTWPVPLSARGFALPWDRRASPSAGQIQLPNNAGGLPRNRGQ
jgi:hypothetical protein